MVQTEAAHDQAKETILESNDHYKSAVLSEEVGHLLERSKPLVQFVSIQQEINGDDPEDSIECTCHDWVPVEVRVLEVESTHLDVSNSNGYRYHNQECFHECQSFPLFIQVLAADFNQVLILHFVQWFLFSIKFLDKKFFLLLIFFKHNLVFFAVEYVSHVIINNILL